MSWASRRKGAYLSIIFLVFFIPAAIIAGVWWYQAPTCFDGELNQGEYSIDRGGPCKLLDERQLIPYSISWSRPFTVREGVAGAATYIENPNQGAGVKAAPYRIRLYDDRGVLVAEYEGVTPIMPGRTTPVFDGNLPTGSRTAVRSFFEFTDTLVWERLTDRTAGIEIQNKTIANEDTQPRIEATVINTYPRGIENLKLVATAFDSAGNAFASSQTIIPFINGRESAQVTFTWPEAFDRHVARVDVLSVLTPTD